MEDMASEAGKKDQSRPRQEAPAWLRPLLSVLPAIGGQPKDKDEEETGDTGIRLTYDLKDTLTANRFVGLWRMATGFRAIYLAAVAATGLAALSRSAVFYVLRYFVDDVLTDADLQWQIPWVAAGITALALLQGLFSFGMGRLAAQTAEGVARRLRNYLYDHIQRLTFTYHDTMQTGELIQRATSDVDTLRRLFQDQLIGIGRTGLLFLVNISALALLHGWLALLSIPMLPVVAVASFFFFKRMQTVFESYQSQDAAVSNRLQERLTGVRVVKAFARQSYEIDSFDEENWEKYRRGVKIANLHTAFWPFVEIMTGGQILFGMYMAFHDDSERRNQSGHICRFHRPARGYDLACARHWAAGRPCLDRSGLVEPGAGDNTPGTGTVGGWQCTDQRASARRAAVQKRAVRL